MIGPGQSALVLRDFQTGDITAPSVSTTEGMPISGGQPFSCPLKWDELGPTVRAGLAGRATVTGQPVTIRLRAGGVPNDRPVVAGSIVHSFVLPVGANQFFEQVSPAFSTPAAPLSYLQVTAQTASGSANLTIAHAVPVVLPDALMQALLFATPNEMLWASTTELNRMEWLLDCSRFTSETLRIVLAARTYKASGGTGTFRVRLGGSHLGNDGTVVLTLTTAASTFDGALAAAQADIPNPGGLQYLKVTSQSGAGFAWEMRGASLLVKGI